MPNNIIYEHDYRKEKEERISQTHSENSDRAFQLAQDTGVYKAIDDRIRALPHVLNPIKKEAYEKTLAILERYAAHWGGYIKGTISYEIFDSYLYLDLPFHEFVNRDNMDELIFIAQNARSICFSTEENGLIRMAVHIDYFEEIGDIDTIIEEEVLKRPELCDALIESHESEIEAILANPKLVSMLEPQAEKLGLTVEEFARKLDQALAEHPDEFIDIMTEAFRKRHDKNYREE